jgi:hypothetical protein
LDGGWDHVLLELGLEFLHRELDCAQALTLEKERVGSDIEARRKAEYV